MIGWVSGLVPAGTGSIDAMSCPVTSGRCERCGGPGPGVVSVGAGAVVLVVDEVVTGGGVLVVVGVAAGAGGGGTPDLVVVDAAAVLVADVRVLLVDVVDVGEAVLVVEVVGDVVVVDDVEVPV
jgi:hypothetical protein